MLTTTHTQALSALPCDDVLTGAELTRAQIEGVLDTALDAKHDITPYAASLKGRSVVMLFEKPSLRTRVTFEVGVFRLGGQAIYLDHQDNKIGAREPILDYGKNLERWTHAIVARVDKHATLDALAKAANVPVVNALSDLWHPCQALADVLTMREKFGTVEGLRVVYVGEGNNVCASLALTCATLGAHVTLISPPGFALREAAAAKVAERAKASGASFTMSEDIADARGHEVVYTDTWASMGAGVSPEERYHVFAPYQVDVSVMRKAGADAVFMHCLPAHRGQEVTPGVIDSARSIVYDQAENRLHAQVGLLLHLLCAEQAGSAVETEVKSSPVGKAARSVA
ncbi:MAG: ornithine carbamoyltransferase [Phycisphaerales bacterium]|nr:MAG: ornithine carbamoyltransferase [Phycisphaerales bacterium]